MKIADLFVGLGIEGDKKTNSAITGVYDNLSKTKSMAMGTKVAMAAAIYGLHKWMKSSADQGTKLLNFTSITGLSSKKLQQWQFAARNAGMESEELQGNVEGIQSSMTDMLMGKGAPDGLGILSNLVGFDPAKARDTFYVLKKYQEFAQKAPVDLGTSTLKSLGLTSNMIALMRRGTFVAKNYKDATFYTPKEISNLNKADGLWKSIFHKFEIGMGKLMGKEDSLKMLGDLSGTTGELVKMIGAFADLARKLELVKGLGKVFEGWGLIFGVIGSTVDKMNAPPSSNKESEKKNYDDSLSTYLSQGFVQRSKEMINGYKNMFNGGSSIDNDMRPAMSGISKPQSNQPINIEQVLNFNSSGDNAQEIGNSVRKATESSMRQMRSQVQVK